MVTVKEKITVTQRIRGNCPTHSRTEISVRDVRTVIDEPKEREGTNMEKVKTDLHRFCPISKVIRNPGTELEEVWNVRRR